ncbi:MAG: hypothetical protein COZ27_01525 [Candidatus Moranbacteria bacterium CG_4_10_14_3_um_filter_41_65]|nr:MAG: hypothetical protein AUK58_02325 [Candidatus Moranbacteria bacterium CG2_30_41_165]PIP25472.1 MAG: hypothetical protein COX32_03190 [Candidatus Moranbacteria bacterium CG23_combo_of_CG06-09_8_20_14_all_41_28]PIV86051.1 MAG: hypothetical protein COW50_03670 [Candidatus Moranbacteria bacterium CG17_big_fil_post_rev_8_21_14_2_50_41_107]PIW94159.1 MAG: hypothetical protein COZ86_02595 [Candidatus Moranbacteria bacterium CG_4_8_14_3_um_filter_41_13]PIX91681.1 MAG: hypothetical protein COZ27_
MVFTEKNRKKNRLIFFLILPFFCGVIFLTQTHFAEATWYDPSTWVNEILYGIFVMFGIFASLAITIFEWAIKPESIQELMNNPGVYESWKFIRDFFNLFFILILLYTAFSVIFQIEKNFKKTLLSLVLAALFINFSFPVSRALIDMTNVPMYFFANQMMAREGGNTDLFGQVMSATALETKLLPKKDESDVSRILMAIVFLFIFSVTLLVLSVMFVIRLVVLVVLVMFSSVGFAASIIPKLDTYGKMWWENFWKYAFFGPAAMLMLLMSVRVFSSLGAGTAGTSSKLIQGMQTVAGTTSIEPSFYASMLLFTIPIIMLWVAMGLAQKMSIAGAGSVVGKGQAFSKWMGKKAYNNPLTNNAYTRGVVSGLKERAENNKVLKFATPKYWKDASKQKEERVAGRVGSGRDGYNRVVENQHNKKVAEAEKKMEEERMSEGELRRRMNDRTSGTDNAEIEAATRILSKKDMLRNGAEMNEAISAMAHANRSMAGAIPEKTEELTKKAGAEIYNMGADLAAAIGRLGNNTKAIVALIDKASDNALNMSDAEYQSIANVNPAVKNKLDGKMRKEGRTGTLVSVAASAPGGSAQAAVKDLFDGMTAEEVAKQRIFTDPRYANEARQHIRDLEGSGIMEDVQRVQEIRKKLNKSVNDAIG